RGVRREGGAGDVGLSRDSSAHEAVNFTVPTVEHLDRLTGMAGEVDTPHVIPLLQLWRSVRVIDGHFSPDVDEPARTVHPFNGLLELGQLGSDDLVVDDRRGVLDLSFREPGAGIGLHRAVRAEQAGGRSRRRLLPLRRGKPFELAFARRALTAEEAVAV